MFRWFKKREPVEDTGPFGFGPHIRKLQAEGKCGFFMRAPGAISCGWMCDLPAGHEAGHAWHYGPTFDEPEGGVVRFTDADADKTNGRRASVAEMLDWEKRSAS